MIQGILSGFGLAAASGLNAYVPLLLVGMLARWTDLIRLHQPYDVLSHTAVLIVLAVLGVLDFIGDKIPLVDHVLHVVGVVVHSTAGIIVFLAANSGADGIDPILASACGMVVALATHGVRALVRPVVTGTTSGLGNPVVSLIEDVIALVLTILAVTVPLLACAAVLGITILMARQIRRAWRRLTRPRLRPPPLPPRRRR